MVKPHLPMLSTPIRTVLIEWVSRERRTGVNAGFERLRLDEYKYNVEIESSVREPTWILCN